MMVALAACSQPRAAGVARTAFLKFDDLTGEQAVSWIATAAPGILVRELSGATGTLAIPVDTVRDAYLTRATTAVHGYFEMRADTLHFEVELEDLARHKMIRTISADGDVVTAISSVAKALFPQATAFSTTSNEAIAAWVKGDNAAAVMLDPDFGPAWLAWCQKLAADNNTTEALATAGRALERPGLRSAADRAQLQLLAATIRRDQAAQEHALTDLQRLMPADPAVSRALGETETQARRFPEAAAAYRAAAETDPGDAANLNTLGYAEALAGNVDEARKALAEYAKRPGQSVNAADSLGEALFLNGKFQDAERAFLDAHAKEPAFLGGEDLWKAAHARWLAGDLPGADGIAQQYFEQRLKQHDALVVWRRANWMYETGRREQAVGLLMNAPAEVAELARKQLAVWSDPRSVPADLAMLKQAYETAAPTEDGLARTFYAAALLRAGQPEEARKLVALWPLPKATDSREALMYPMFLELRRELK